MKTQIIALEAHDDLISVRDRMSWAKSPRILLVWPKYLKLALRAADLRILQRHASNLGAELGVITRRGDVRRDAQQFGIPVFASSAAAQRQAWPKVGAGMPSVHRPRRERSELEAMRTTARPGPRRWVSHPATRIAFFLLGVLAVLAIAAVFVPHATITIRPVSKMQNILLPVAAGPSIQAVSLAGGVPAYERVATVDGTQSARVATQSTIPDRPARGIARFTNLSQSDVTIPAGTVVYSLSPTAIQFTTSNDTHLPGNINAVIEVPIVSVSGGADANLPANAIRAIQGSLSLSAAVNNPQPTTGGTDRVAAVPSDADRQRLHDVLLAQLKAEAESRIREAQAGKDMALPDTLKLVQITEETYDPEPGKPGNLLKLTLKAEFSEQYVKADDISQLVDATLDGSKPAGFLALPETLTSSLAEAPRADDTGVSHFALQLSRRLVHDVDLDRAGAIVQGSPVRDAATRLQASFALAGAPSLVLSPRWWPWMPLIPLRTTVVSVP